MTLGSPAKGRRARRLCPCGGYYTVGGECPEPTACSDDRPKRARCNASFLETAMSARANIIAEIIAGLAIGALLAFAFIFGA